MTNIFRALNESLESMTKPRRKLNEEKEICKYEWWGQVDDDPYEMAKEFNLTCKKLDSRKDETLYSFCGKESDFENAKKAGYFYSYDYKDIDEKDPYDRWEVESSRDDWDEDDSYISEACNRKKEIKKLTENRWQYTLKSGEALRDAIDSGDFYATRDALIDCMEEAQSMSEDFEDEFQDDIDYLTTAEIEDFDNEDEAIEALDFYLDQLYDFCDNVKIWIPLNESKNSKMKNKQFKHRKSLDEAMPPELMKLIRQNKNNNEFNTTSYYNDKYGFTIASPAKTLDQLNQKGKSNILDYANADYKEIDTDEILRRKKNGEDLSSIYMLFKHSWTKAPDVYVKLDSEGKIEDSNSYRYRTNTSLKTLLNDGELFKIYDIDLKDVYETQPEKIRNRLSSLATGDNYYYDTTERDMNYRLGHTRFNRGYDNLKPGAKYKKEYFDKLARNNENKAVAQRRYDRGEISRNEYERIMAEEPWISSYDVQRYQTYRNRQADARNFAANASASEKIRKFKELKRQMADAKYDLKDAERNLSKFTSGNTDYWSQGSYYRNKEELENARKEIERLRKQLEYYEKRAAEYETKINDDTYNKDLQKFEQYVTDAANKVNKLQDRIDTILKRK